MPYLTPQQARLRDDIRGLIKGEVRCDEITIQLYSTDASILQCRPQGVVWPRDIEDVVACVRYAVEGGIPIHARGAGTGTAGESLGGGLVVDFSRFMRRILSLDREQIVVQPGMVRHHLNDMLEKMQCRRFAPVAGFSPATTIGSLIARNGAGPHWLRDGLPVDHLLGLKVVLADGELLTLDRRDLPQALGPPEEATDPSDGEHRVAHGIALARGIVLGREHVVADEVYRALAPLGREPETMPQFLNVDRAGYRVRDVLQGADGTCVDLARLVAGSEGTLGLIVEATLATVPIPDRSGAAVLFFNGLEKAVQAVASLFPFDPVLCELVDRRRLSMVRDWDPRFRDFLPTEAEAALLVELEAGTFASPLEAAGVRDRLSRLLKTVREKESLCFHAIRIETPESFALFDAFLRRAESALFRMRRSFQPLPLFDDLAVPLPSIRNFLLELLGLLRRHEITASISGHVGQGHLRVHPIVDLTRPALAQTLRHLAEDVYALVLEHGGTISSEGGTGLLKSQFVPRQFPALASTFRDIKAIFDPDNLLNPGKVLPDATPWTRYLRPGLARRGADHPEPPPSASSLPLAKESSITEPAQPLRFGEFASQLELQLRWEPERVFETTYFCNGCGDCFQTGRSGRMCPLFRGFAEEEAAPRAKANLLRGVLEGDVELETLTLSRAREIADLCFHCQMCAVECPAEVDVSLLAFRCKSAYVAAHGLPLGDLFLARIDSVLRWLAMISCPVNWATSNRFARWVMEKMLQIPQSRPLPKLAKVTFLGRTQWSSRRRPQPESAAPRVALFVDTFANHFDTKLADLAVRILEHNGLSVYVPPRQRGSGLTAFALGHMDRAERLARHNTLLLADLIRQGYHVVTLEPASASCITRDYRYVVEGIDTALVTSNVVDFCTFLMERHRAGELRTDFEPVPRTVGYHAPCRSLAVSTPGIDGPTPAEELLRLIPDLDVRRFERGCCGLAGTFGLKRKNNRRSLRIGLGLFRKLRLPEIECGVSDCSACRMQMEHGAKKKTFHPIRFLAAAYGLAPAPPEHEG